jgi:hypothetical protein
MLQSRDQRQAIVETAMACTPRGRHVVVHVGAASLDDAVSLASHAAKAGAQAISSLPPTSAQFSSQTCIATTRRWPGRVTCRCWCTTFPRCLRRSPLPASSKPCARSRT